tara:strand:+ start:358 stop:507 length:150 start_codon:yes stop_codon:yes gene_type:complete
MTCPVCGEHLTLCLCNPDAEIDPVIAIIFLIIIGALALLIFGTEILAGN